MTVNDLLENCAEVKSGQQVVIVAAFDGRAGGANRVEAFALHGGVHPHAKLARHQCLDDRYRDSIEHHHWSNLHLRYAMQGMGV